VPDVDVVPANTIDNNLFATTDLKKYRRVRNCKPPFQVLLKHLLSLELVTTWRLHICMVHE